jgi:predicted kinase
MGKMNESRKIVYLMRGLPACGKSHMARRLAGEKGLVLETDQFFYSQVGDDPAKYDYSEELLPTARAWNLDRFHQAIAEGVTPTVVDRGNGLNQETMQYARYAVDHGYDVELAEPDSPWWQELRVLLKYKQFVDATLFDTWSKRLADATRDTHRVPSSVIRTWMTDWRYDITVEAILAEGASVLTKKAATRRRNRHGL